MLAPLRSSCGAYFKLFHLGPDNPLVEDVRNSLPLYTTSPEWLAAGPVIDEYFQGGGAESARPKVRLGSLVPRGPDDGIQWLEGCLALGYGDSERAPLIIHHVRPAA